MADLLNHGKKKNKDVSVKVNTVTRQQAGFGDSTNSEEEIANFDVNMRVSNHVRNSVLSLSKVIEGKKIASDVISILVDSYVGKMDQRTRKAYEQVVNVMEAKDYIDHSLKQ